MGAPCLYHLAHSPMHPTACRSPGAGVPALKTQPLWQWNDGGQASCASRTPSWAAEPCQLCKLGAGAAGAAALGCNKVEAGSQLSSPKLCGGNKQHDAAVASWAGACILPLLALLVALLGAPPLRALAGGWPSAWLSTPGTWWLSGSCANAAIMFNAQRAYVKAGWRVGAVLDAAHALLLAGVGLAAWQLLATLC